ncbi:MAG: DEAD/DEAH box helicase [Candidatus Omnitrophica bacterium]|nr:DEAD/DEAH box helicase [Candidatus Omnitrophota bacterium]
MTLEFNVLRIAVGDKTSHELLRDGLRTSGYIETHYVSRPGEFSFRGFLLDIFPLTYKFPVRIAYQADEVESIRDFSPTSSKTFNAYTSVQILPVSDAYQKHLSGYEKQIEDKEPLENLIQIRRGDYVVHLKYGIAKFLGARQLKIVKEAKRYLALEFANKEILYLEPSEVRMMERYIGLRNKEPRLTRLHTKDWVRIKEKTRLAIKNLAQDLLELQARRSVLKGLKSTSDGEWMRKFVKEFPFEETPDQTKAWGEVRKDMEEEKPMDRLLCGDVGFGKTEIAMRAAFKAVMSGRQTVFLVPTTVLAEQHYLSLSRRVQNFPVRVKALSRFQSKGEQKAVVEGLKSGEIDIVIGTHRLLSPDISFKNLGLVIIDEEQRFGVKHKEKLKHLRELVDILTLTATPIPRTLYLSLVGSKDMSTINTPPDVRLPVQTEIIHFDEVKITQAIREELSREGQIYFVHNRVESIERIYERLKKRLPDVRFGVAHGQLHPRDLEEVMILFINGKLDCLIATNIIESGLDIPNANTIFVNRADTFGLADLYQLRGRVGRFTQKRKAYAYLIVPGNAEMTEDAAKRISAIERFTELGSGFKIAMEDLEIRGAGNILGSEQSGFIYQVGFDLYCRLLAQTIEEEKKRLKLK